jgi:hypothetical protein
MQDAHSPLLACCTRPQDGSNSSSPRRSLRTPLLRLFSPTVSCACGACHRERWASQPCGPGGERTPGAGGLVRSLGAMSETLYVAFSLRPACVCVCVCACVRACVSRVNPPLRKIILLLACICAVLCFAALARTAVKRAISIPLQQSPEDLSSIEVSPTHTSSAGRRTMSSYGSESGRLEVSPSSSARLLPVRGLYRQLRSIRRGVCVSGRVLTLVVVVVLLLLLRLLDCCSACRCCSRVECSSRRRCRSARPVRHAARDVPTDPATDPGPRA